MELIAPLVLRTEPLYGCLGHSASVTARENRMSVETAEAVKGLHATHTWEPYSDWDLHGEGGKRHGYRRSDGMGYVLPEGDRWWVTWHHDLVNGPGWHHHALGSYVSANAGAMTFDIVYELERLAGNRDRMSGADAIAAAARSAET